MGVFHEIYPFLSFLFFYGEIWGWSLGLFVIWGLMVGYIKDMGRRERLVFIEGGGVWSMVHGNGKKIFDTVNPIKRHSFYLLYPTTVLPNSDTSFYSIRDTFGSQLSMETPTSILPPPFSPPWPPPVSPSYSISFLAH